jgi:hypothetical protein
MSLSARYVIVQWSALCVPQSILSGIVLSLCILVRLPYGAAEVFEAFKTDKHYDATVEQDERNKDDLGRAFTLLRQAVDSFVEAEVLNPQVCPLLCCAALRWRAALAGRCGPHHCVELTHMLTMGATACLPACAIHSDCGDAAGAVERRVWLRLQSCRSAPTHRALH